MTDNTDPSLISQRAPLNPYMNDPGIAGAFARSQLANTGPPPPMRPMTREEYYRLPPPPRAAVYASGLTTGGHIAFAIATLFTCGLALPVWIIVAFLGRRRIS